PDVAGQPNPVTTSATFNAPGTYVLSLSASDSLLTISSNVTITVNAPPTLLSANPASGQQGQSVSVTITGQFTHFAQGTTSASFGSGIAVGTVTVASATSLTATISI